MSKPNLRLIGDVHGNIEQYMTIARGAEYSIQLGDLGFDYSLLQTDFSPEFHRVLAGNHDNYESVDGNFVNQTPHFLGDFGVLHVPKVGDVFFVRGGRSIDHRHRTLGLDYWPDEELSHARANEAFELYKNARPDLVISHECPRSVIRHVSSFDYFDGAPVVPSFTANLLQEMLDAHRPSVWYFGHYHKRYMRTINGTEFNCLEELEHCDIYDLKSDGDINK